MIKQIKYRTFSRDKSIDELHYSTELWTSELEFTAFELPLLRRLIKSYPYNNTIPNLFEKIQLFKQQLEELGLKLDLKQ